MPKLALLGGKPVRSKPFPRYNSIGAEEKKAAAAVLDSGMLSDFLGTWGGRFEGGPQVKALEGAWRERFCVPHAVTMNSATSALYAAIGALGLGPGDEVIVSPYTMSASATCAVVAGATPVFADVEPDYFCLDPKDVARKITPRTRAIVAVDLAGQPAAFEELQALAHQYKLAIVEDCAQAPGALYKGKAAGTLGNIGIYSLNCHKAIQTGEGGVAVAHEEKLALRLKLIRNHAEACLGGMPEPSEDLASLVGFNYRMTELGAGIGQAQLAKLDVLTRERVDRVRYLNAAFSKIRGLTPPAVRPDCSHVYYIQMLRYDETAVGISRDVFLDALAAEGVPAGAGYVAPLYRLPLFRKLLRGADPNCPVVERLHEREVIVNALVHPPLTHQDLDDIADAYAKVVEHAGEVAGQVAARAG